MITVPTWSVVLTLIVLCWAIVLVVAYKDRGYIPTQGLFAIVFGVIFTLVVLATWGWLR